MYIDRKIASTLLEATRTRPVVLVTGPRQVGKTTLLRRSFPGHAYLSFDSMLLAASAEEAPEEFVARLEGPIVIDEVQYAPAVLRAIKARVDAERGSFGRWLLTGSQRFELMRGAGESLAGRISILELASLSAAELRRAGFLAAEIGDELYLRGGYPELWAEREVEASLWFEDYIRTYVERDLKAIVNVKNLLDFRRFLGAAAARAGELLNYADLANGVGVSVNTIKSWVAALELSGLCYLLPPYFTNIGKRLVKTPKLYFADLGLLCALLGLRDGKLIDSGGLRGRLWEHLVFLELIKEGGFRPGRELFFYRDHGGAEVDFIAIDGGALRLIEAKHSERIRPERLAGPALTETLAAARAAESRIRCLVAAPTGANVLLPGRGYDVYDPRYTDGGSLSAVG